MKTACVLGFGKSGTSATRFLLHLGYTVIATDDNFSEGADLFFRKFEKTPHLLLCPPQEIIPENFDFVVASPGIRKTHPLIEKCRRCNIEVFCDIELAFRFMKNTEQKVVGITGTNGKTTTTLLVEHMLKQQNISAIGAGNIGLPICDVLLRENQPEVLVLELSSYQLETISTKKIDIAAILNISPNHLDWHASFDEYKKAKFRIANALQKDGVLLLPQSLKNFEKPAEYFSLDRFEDIGVDTKRVQLFEHDRLNFIVAYSIARKLGVVSEVAKEALYSFKKPDHRIQLVAEIEGISFYDDSKATNIDAVIQAVLAFKQPVVLIAGGLHKGSSYSKWIPHFRGNVREVVCYGQAKDLIFNDLNQSIPTHKATSFEDAVFQAKLLAKRGDVVLLSPGASSLDLFKSYEERGILFQTLVKSL